MQLHSLFEIIRKAQERNSAFGSRMAEAQALGRWELAVGEGIARHARAVRVYNSILWVEVAHPIWRSELHYRKQQILDILNGKTQGAKKDLGRPDEILKDIQFVDPRRTTS